MDVERIDSPRSLAHGGVDVSVLVPAKDEAENLPRFMELAAKALGAGSLRYEVVVIDDGSRRQHLERARVAARVVSLPANRQAPRRAAASPTRLRTGFHHSRGAVLVFYPADLQFMPEDIPRLVAPIVAGEADMVTGFKQGKYEKAFVSRVYNGLSRALFGIRVKDLNSVKAYRREVMDAHPGTARLAPLHDRARRRAGLLRQGDPGAAVPAPCGQVQVRRLAHSRRRARHAVGLVRAQVRARSRSSSSACSAPRCSLLSAIAGIVLLGTGQGVRAAWVAIQTGLILGTIVFVAGLIGELIAGNRAQLRELRRQVDRAAQRSLGSRPGMRVLFLTHSYPRTSGDAAGSFLLHLATALKQQDVDVTRGGAGR